MALASDELCNLIAGHRVSFQDDDGYIGIVRIIYHLLLEQRLHRGLRACRARADGKKVSTLDAPTGILRSHAADFGLINRNADAGQPKVAKVQWQKSHLAHATQAGLGCVFAS